MDTNVRVSAFEAFRDAVAQAGGQSAFQRKTGLLQQTTSNLLKRSEILPAEYVLVTERELGVSRHLLRPDIYPPADVPVTPPGEDASVAPGGPIPSCDRPAISQRNARA